MKKVLFCTLLILALACSSIAFAFELDVDPVPPTGLESPVQKILGVAQWIGFAVAIGMLIWVGIKYLTAGAGQKAEVKSTLIPMLVGALLVALASPIAKAVFALFTGDGGVAQTGAQTQAQIDIVPAWDEFKMR